MATSTALNLNIRFLSDWHVGSGLEQPGGPDQLVQRDTDGLPYIPAKTLTGVLRDAAEQAASALDSRPGGRWHQWVLWLFGDQPTRKEILNGLAPRPAALSVRPARLVEGLRQILGDDPGLNELQRRMRQELRDSLAFEKAGVRIGDSGGADDGSLRQIEMIRGGVQLTSSVSLDLEGLSDAERNLALGLFSLSSATVARLGGKRRRGAGRVQLTVSGNDGMSCTELAGWLEALSTDDIPDIPAPPDTGWAAEPPDGSPAEEGGQIRERSGNGTADRTAAAETWEVLPFQLTLQTPLLIADRTVGNVVQTLDFVPGTFLLPIISRALRAHFPAVGAAVADGDVRITPATLQINGQRGLPVPAALFHAKGADRFDRPGAVRNAFREPAIAHLAQHVKDFRHGYLVPQSDGQLPRYSKPHRVVRPHNTIDEERQRPTTDVGGVFACEAIAAGTVLCGEIRLRQSVADQLKGTRWWDAAVGPQSLGRSRKDDYGQVVLQIEEPRHLQADQYSSTQQLSVWLTSDTVLRNARGRMAPTADDLRRAVAAVMGHKEETVAIVDDNCGQHACLRHRRIESWHVRWGLPRPSLVCLAAGSCIELKFKTPPTASEIRQLTVEGIGLRKAEGYGTLRVQSRLLGETLSRWGVADVHSSGIASQDVATPPVEPDSPQWHLAQFIETECWKRRISRAAVAATSTSEARKIVLRLGDSGQPTPAQASLLRNLLRVGLDAASVGRRLVRLEQMRGDKWPPGALRKIRQLFSNESIVWQQLAENRTEEGDDQHQQLDWPVLTAGAHRRLMGSTGEGGLRELAVRTLIETGLRAHQRDRERRRVNRKNTNGEQD